jgi:hypothetical protein
MPRILVCTLVAGALFGSAASPQTVSPERHRPAAAERPVAVPEKAPKGSSGAPTGVVIAIVVVVAIILIGLVSYGKAEAGLLDKATSGP